MKQIVIFGTALALAGCVVEPARMYAPPPYQPMYPQAQPVPMPQQPGMAYQDPQPQPVVSMYVDPPMEQPAPVQVAWAPPPMLVETPPPMPYPEAVWIGGYWVWEGNWIWAHGRWAGPPQPGYGWVNPYYEHRNGNVVFVNGFWAAPGVRFVPPPMGISIAVGMVAAGVVMGPRCMGPEGPFVPPPPGSHNGLIVPAPIGTAPAVVTGAPPIVSPGMRVSPGGAGHFNVSAPAGTTANGQGFNGSAPAQPHLAAAVNPVVHAYAPLPASQKPIPSYVAGQQPARLPPAQMVHPSVSPSYQRPAAVPYGNPQGTPQGYAPAQPAQRMQPAEPAAPMTQHAAPTQAPNEYREPIVEPKPQPKPQPEMQYRDMTEPRQMPQPKPQMENQYRAPAEPRPMAQPKPEPKPQQQKRSEEPEHEREHER